MHMSGSRRPLTSANTFKDVHRESAPPHVFSTKQPIHANGRQAMRIDDLMHEAMTAVGSHRRAQGKTLTGFLGLAGAKYDQQLMIIGRAVNGWTEWQAAELRDQGAIRHFIRQLRHQSGPCPLSWVTSPPKLCKYNARRSAFWRTTRKVYEALTRKVLNDEDWASHLAWSNLYKISNAQGNPPDWMCAAQDQQCVEILNEELNQFEPKHILFSTGLDWVEPFIKQLANNYQHSIGRFAEAYGRIPIGNQKASFVVASHPMTKPEAEWVSDVTAGFVAAEMD